MALPVGLPRRLAFEAAAVARLCYSAGTVGGSRRRARSSSGAFLRGGGGQEQGRDEDPPATVGILREGSVNGSVWPYASYLQCGLLQKSRLFLPVVS